MGDPDDMDLVRWEHEILEGIEQATARSDPEFVRLLSKGDHPTERWRFRVGLLLAALGAGVAVAVLMAVFWLSVAGVAVMGVGLWLVATSDGRLPVIRRARRWQERLGRLIERMADND